MGSRCPVLPRIFPSTGDRGLTAIAQVLTQGVQRPGDLAARYGGEEFILILPRTSLRAATYVCQRILHQLKDLQISHQGSQVNDHLTLSIGIATVVPQATFTCTWLLGRADTALYQAKAQGRNRIVASTEVLPKGYEIPSCPSPCFRLRLG